MVRICLLVPTSSRTEYRAAPRPPVARLRNRLRRAADWLAWRAGFRDTLHYSTYQDHIDTNRGDSAIRIASTQVLREAFGPDADVEEIAWFELADRADWIVAHADLFVIGGGGYYFLDEDGRLAPRVTGDVALLRRLRCPVVSLASGVNRLLIDQNPEDPDRLDPATHALLAECLERMSLSSVRDDISRRVLDTVAPGRTVVVADPALFWPPPPWPPPPWPPPPWPPPPWPPRRRASTPTRSGAANSRRVGVRRTSCGSGSTWRSTAQPATR